MVYQIGFRGLMNS